MRAGATVWPPSRRLSAGIPTEITHRTPLVGVLFCCRSECGESAAFDLKEVGLVSGSLAQRHTACHGFPSLEGV
jgi:hypothetical protein